MWERLKKGQLRNMILNSHFPPKNTPQVDHSWNAYVVGVTLRCIFHSENNILLNC